MIIDKTVGFLFAVLDGVLGLFPAWTLPFDLASMGDGFGVGIRSANAFFPVSTLGACIGAVIGLRGVLLGWRVVVWVYDKIPFKMT